MNFELADKLSEYLKNGELDTAIQIAEQELKQLPLSPFHKILDRNCLHMQPVLTGYLNDFYNEAMQFYKRNKTNFIRSIFKTNIKHTSILKTIYCEMNGFTINYDRWFIDLFAYNEEGFFDDLDWISDFQYSSSDSLTITGFEDLQLVYKDYMEKEKWKDKQLESCSDICEFLIIHRLQELFRKTFETAKSEDLPWSKIPTYITAHDYDLVYRTSD